jgi:uncharacterized protein (TIRG00374 family)
LLVIRTIWKRAVALLRGWVGWVLRIVVTVALFYVMFHFFVQPQELLQALGGVLIGWLLAATLVKAVGIVSAILRWDLLLRAQGIRVPFLRLVASFLVGRFFGMFTPSTLGLDAYRAYDIGVRARDGIGSVAVIVVEKVTGFFTLSLLVLVTLPAGLSFVSPLALLSIGLVFCLPVALAFLLLLRPGLFERLLGWRFPGKARVEKWLRQAVAAITAYRDHRRYLWLAVALGLLVHGATALMYYCTARAVQAGVSLADMLFVGPLIIVFTVGIPTLGGEGAREFGGLGLLTRIGVPEGGAWLVGHLGFWFGELPPVVLGGLILALRPAAERGRREGRRYLRDGLLPGLAGGGLAGLLIGIGEVVALAASEGGAGYLTALPYAALLYAALGLLGGAVLGSLLYAFTAAGQCAAGRWTCALLLAGMGGLVARYRLVRDVFEERLQTFSPQGLLVHAGLIAGAAGLAALVLFLARLVQRTRAGRLLARGGVFVLMAILVGAAFLTAALAQPRPAQAPVEAIPQALRDKPNVILIGVDTLRADRLGCYGYPEKNSPAIDALAADGVLYRNMLAQSSWTKPSFATIFTSLYPSSHTAVSKANRLPQGATTLAEVLRAAGYTTGGIADNINVAPLFGFDQGFDSYNYLEPDYPLGASATSSELTFYQALRRVYAFLTGDRVVVQEYYQDADTVTRAALGWLEEHRGGRFFLFLHYMDPHDPYMAHPYNGVGYARASNQNPDPGMAPTFSRLYDGEIRYLDQYLGQLFAWLKQAGLYEDTLIVLTGDHGEEFQEHGGWWHGETLYEELLRVPLIVKYARGARTGTEVAEVARSLDIAPTVVDALGLSIPSTWQGRSLWSATEPPAYTFAEEEFEGNVIREVQQGPRKLILANRENPRGLPAEALFDLSTDPGEQHNVAKVEAGWVSTLREVLQRAQAEALAQRLEAEAGSVDSKAQEMLRKLGY